MEISVSNINVINLNTVILNLDVSGLRTFYKFDSTARHILESLAIRQNNWKTTTVSSLYSIFRSIGLVIPRQEIIRVFKEFGKFNCGKFVPGKVAGDRSLQSRFVWSVPPGIVGKIAMDKKSRD